jgi:hypothetical protein
VTAGVHRGAPRDVELELPSGLSGQLELAMGGDVPISHGGIEVLCKHIARGPHEQRSERQLAGRDRLVGEFDCPGQVLSSASVMGPPPSIRGAGSDDAN